PDRHERPHNSTRLPGILDLPIMRGIPGTSPPSGTPPAEVGEGRCATHASVNPLCLPVPTSVSPSPLTPLAVVKTQPVRLIPSVGRYVLRSTITSDDVHSIAALGALSDMSTPTTTWPLP